MKSRGKFRLDVKFRFWRFISSQLRLNIAVTILFSYYIFSTILFLCQLTFSILYEAGSFHSSSERSPAFVFSCLRSQTLYRHLEGRRARVLFPGTLIERYSQFYQTNSATVPKTGPSRYLRYRCSRKSACRGTSSI